MTNTSPEPADAESPAEAARSLLAGHLPQVIDRFVTRAGPTAAPAVEIVEDWSPDYAAVPELEGLGNLSGSDLETVVPDLEPSAELVWYLLNEWPWGLTPWQQIERIDLALDTEERRHAFDGPVDHPVRQAVAEHTVLRVDLALQYAPGSPAIRHQIEALIRELSRESVLARDLVNGWRLLGRYGLGRGAFREARTLLSCAAALARRLGFPGCRLDAELDLAVLDRGDDNPGAALARLHEAHFTLWPGVADGSRRRLGYELSRTHLALGRREDARRAEQWMNAQAKPGPGSLDALEQASLHLLDGRILRLSESTPDAAFDALAQAEARLCGGPFDDYWRCRFALERALLTGERQSVEAGALPGGDPARTLVREILHQAADPAGARRSIAQLETLGPYLFVSAP